MFNFFKPKKVYCVRFSWNEHDTHIYQEIVTARDIADAWDKITEKHPLTAGYCHSITEINSTKFNGVKNESRSK